MASYPVTVFRWDDPGAPQIGNGRASDIINIWQKCLVEGYGTKTPLGWTRPFYDATTQRAIYRNNVAAGGSGGYAILFSNTLNDVDYNVMRLSHAKSMTDINTAIGQGFTKAFQVVNTSGNLRRTKWVLIGTAIGFYFSISYDNFQLDGQTNASLPSMFVGDFFSRTPNDSGRFIAECQPSASGDNSSAANAPTLDVLSSYLSSIGAQTPLKIFATDNTNEFRNYAIAFHFNTHPTSSVSIESTTPQILFPISISVNTIFGVNTPTNSSATNDSKNPAYRGQLPGIFNTANPYLSSRPYPTIINFSGADYWLMRTYSGGPGTLINMEVWDDPFN